MALTHEAGQWGNNRRSPSLILIFATATALAVPLALQCQWQCHSLRERIFSLTRSGAAGRSGSPLSAVNV